MNACVVDASVWVCRFLQGDVHYEPTRRWLTDYVEQGGTCVVPVLGLIEVSGAIARRTDDSSLARRVVDAIVGIPGTRVVPVDAQLGQEAVDVAADLRLRGADAVYVAVADQVGVPLVTWDHEQRERSASLISSYTPPDAFPA